MQGAWGGGGEVCAESCALWLAKQVQPATPHALVWREGFCFCFCLHLRRCLHFSVHRREGVDGGVLGSSNSSQLLTHTNVLAVCCSFRGVHAAEAGADHARPLGDPDAAHVSSQGVRRLLRAPGGHGVCVLARVRVRPQCTLPPMHVARGATGLCGGAARARVVCPRVDLAPWQWVVPAL